GSTGTTGAAVPVHLRRSTRAITYSTSLLCRVYCIRRDRTSKINYAPGCHTHKTLVATTLSNGCCGKSTPRPTAGPAAWASTAPLRQASI
ncbi:hypothetical protein EV182_007742, partial [Spiromyces aspiralis]